MAMTKAWKEASEAKGNPCPKCGAELHAFYKVTLCAPYPFTPGFSKSALRAKTVSIVAADHDLTHPMCIGCGWHDEPAKTEADVILTLMRELVHRGMKPSELQSLLHQSPVGAVDLLAATYPKIAEAD